MENRIELFSRTEVAKIFGVHPLTVREWEKKGKIKPALYVGIFPRYSIESIEKLGSEKPSFESKKATAHGE